MSSLVRTCLQYTPIDMCQLCEAETDCQDITCQNRSCGADGTCQVSRLLCSDLAIFTLG